MEENENIMSLEDIKSELIEVSQKVKEGKITPNVGNAVTNALRASAYVAQVRIQQEKEETVKLEHTGELGLSQADKDRLDAIIKLLNS